MIYLFYKVRHDDIFRIKFLLEAYENMMSVSTVDRVLPKLQITVAPDFIKDVELILADLQKKIFMEKLDEDATRSQGKY